MNRHTPSPAVVWPYRPRDTGSGLSEPSADGTHFGLQQVRERLATLYGTAATLELIAISAGGTSAVVTFPLKPEQP